MEKTTTAEKMYLSIWNKQPSLMDFHDYTRAATTAMIEFAKMHVKAALEAAAKEADYIRIDKAENKFGRLKKHS